MAQVIAIGECMVELARGGDGRYALGFGGDTFNTAVYLARAGVQVAYATALGDDPYSAAILDFAGREGIARELMSLVPGRMPGLYLIETGAAGERSFYYWREHAPARELFESAAADGVAAAMARVHLVYLSGITLSLYSEAGLGRLERALIVAKAAGAQLALDSNYRPRGWCGDRNRARAVLARFTNLADVVLPTFEDEQALWDDAAPQDTIGRLQGQGLPEVVLKAGGDGAHIWHNRKLVHVSVPEPVEAVDTTAAGDSFNAAYLAARLKGLAPAEAARLGHRLAGVVIRHRGAIVPADATWPVLAELGG